MEAEAKKEAERVRKANYRAKQRSISNGTYIPTPIEIAKQILEAMEEPDVAAAFNDERIGAQLKPDDRKTLHNFAYYLKARKRKEFDEEAKRVEQEHQISEKGRMFVN
jgi:hypothetical protein